MTRVMQPSPAPPLAARTVVRSLRAFSLPASVLPVVVATAAVRPVGQWHWGVLLLSMLGVALLHLAGNLLNDYFDFAKGVDRRVEGDEKRPGRLLVRGQITPRQVLAEVAVCLAAAAGIAVYLAWTCGPALLWFALAAAVGLYIYTGPPLHLKYRAMGELNIFVVFGPLLMLGAAWAQTGQFEPAALLLSIPTGLATVAILVGNNCRDLDEDGQANITTIASFAGGRFARALYVASVTGAAVGFAVLAAVGAAPAILLTAPITLVLIAGPVASVARGRRVPDIDAQTARFEALLLIGVIAAYVF